MKNSVLGFLILLLLNSVSAQQLLIEFPVVQNNAGSPITDGVMIYGASSLNKKLTYEDVKGSPFNHSEFKPSIFYGEQSKVLGKVLSRINLFDQTVQYLDAQGAIKSLSCKVVRRVDYVNEENVQEIYTSFRADIYEINAREKKEVFVQMLNQGNIILIKHWNLQLTQYDSLFGTFKKFAFKNSPDYYVYKKGAVDFIRKLGAERILVNTGKVKELNEYIKKHQLNMKKEDDVVRLLNYYHSL